jgi:16S rRNA G527 N7-methylase RsmG
MLSEEGGPYDIIVSRALGSLDMFAGLALPMLAEGGRGIAYKGTIDKARTEEIKALNSKHPELTHGIHCYQLPVSGDSRSLVFIKQTKKTT